MSKQFSRTDRIVDCACVIHGTAYNWIYVERLYNMLEKHIPQGINLHVYTEHDRSVPPYMIKHCLEDWPGVRGPKKSWWYKMHLFNPAHHQGNILYFDLDCIILDSLAFILEKDPKIFWTIRDFKYLQSSNWTKINSSVMWFNVQEYSWVWDRFLTDGVEKIIKSHHGDQDFIDNVIPKEKKRMLEQYKFQSWRWSAFDGGMNFTTRTGHQPGTGTVINPGVSVLVFHGHPKPHEITDPVVQQLWQ